MPSQPCSLRPLAERDCVAGRSPRMPLGMAFCAWGRVPLIQDSGAGVSNTTVKVGLCLFLYWVQSTREDRIHVFEEVRAFQSSDGE